MVKELRNRQVNVWMRPGLLKEFVNEAKELGLSQGALVERWVEEWRAKKEEKKGRVPEGFWVEKNGKRLFVGRVGKRFYVSEDDEAWPVGDWTAIKYWEEKQKEGKK